MTLLHITTQIIGVLCQDHFFSRDGFNGIKIDAKFEDSRDELIKAALEELVSTGMVRQLVGKEIWMMIMPPGSQGQELKLSLTTATWLAETINDFASANKLEIDVVSPLGIHEGHIQLILEIVHDLISEDKDE